MKMLTVKVKLASIYERYEYYASIENSIIRNSCFFIEKVIAHLIEVYRKVSPKWRNRRLRDEKLRAFIRSGALDRLEAELEK